MPKKYTIELIRDKFTEKYLILVTDIYINTKQKLKFKCKKHLEFGEMEISWENFYYQNQGCKHCGKEKFEIKKRKYTLDFVKQCFEEKNLILLENEYKNPHQKLKFICKQHDEHIQEIDFNHLYNRNQGCSFCYGYKRVTLERVINDFKKRNYTVVDESYIPQQKINYICNQHEGIIQSITWGNFCSGNGCKFCGNEKKVEKSKHSFEYVNGVFLDRGYELLENSYINSKTPMKYKCLNHNNEIQKIIFNSLIRGSGCVYCARERVSNNIKGEKHYNWKGGENGLNSYLRSKIYSWLKDSMKKYNYKCAITGEQFDEIHHLHSFSNIVEETLLELNLERRTYFTDYTEDELTKLKETCLKNHYKYPLGIPLKKNIHKEFHLIYGFIHFTPDQFYEFKKFKEDSLTIEQIMSIKEGVAS